MRGSEANDPMRYENGKVKTITNHNGGVLGGISNGNPLRFTVTIKPTASIGKRQETVDISKKEDTMLSIGGRHDPCIVTRAFPLSRMPLPSSCWTCFSREGGTTMADEMKNSASDATARRALTRMKPWSASRRKREGRALLPAL